MRIQSIETTGVRHFGDRIFDLRDRSGRPAQVVVVIGGPGSGKTYLLELIAAAKESVAPYGRPPETRRFVAEDGEAAKVALTLYLSDDEAGDMDTVEAVRSVEAMWGSSLLPPENDPDLVRLLARYDSDSPRAKVEYFAATRALPLGAAASGGKQARLALGSDNAKYDGLDAYLVEVCLDGVARLSTNEASPHLGRFVRMFSSLCGSLSLHGLVKTRAGIQPSFLRGQREIPISELSHSEREALLLSATLCRSTIASSVVLYDEPELHTPPSQLTRRVRALTAFDPANQWIIATSHRALANELAGDGVVIDLGGAA